LAAPLGISSSTPREVASPATSPSCAAQGRSTPSAPSRCCLGALPRRPRALAAQLGPSLRQPRAPAAPPRGSSPPPALSCGHGARPCRLHSGSSPPPAPSRGQGARPCHLRSGELAPTSPEQQPCRRWWRGGAPAERGVGGRQSVRVLGTAGGRASSTAWRRRDGKE